MTKDTTAKQARTVAIKSILRSLQGEDLQASLNIELNKSGMTDQDKNLATMISYNYLRFKGRLDYIVSQYIHDKNKKLPDNFNLCLGLGIYEILHLEKIPYYASVNWYVGYIKQKVSKRLAKTANAIFRKVTGEVEKINTEDFYRQGKPSEATFWSRFYSCPEWIVNLWISSYGRSVCKKMLEKSLQAPPIGIRINQTMPESTHLWQSLYNLPEMRHNRDYTFAFTRTPNINLHKLEANGLISRQSPEIENLFSKLNMGKWELPIWDCCAGNGNKTTLLLEKGLRNLWASDLFWDKIIHCSREINRLNLTRPPLFTANAAEDTPLKKGPSTTLIDAPCSGLGVINRRPDIKWKRNWKEVQTINRLQESILIKQARALPINGTMLYITCTVNPEENENLITNLLDQNSNLELDQEIRPQANMDDNLSGEYFYAAVIKKIKNSFIKK